MKSAVSRLNNDMDHIKARVETLEKVVIHSKSSGFLSELSSSTTAFVIVWPIAAFAIMKFRTK